MKFIVRKVDVTNPLIKAAITAMHDECFPADYRFVPKNGGDWWVAFLGKKEAGFIGFVPSNQGSGTAYLERVGVLPAFRGNGLQTRMTRTGLKAIRSKYRVIVTDCRPFNAPSANSLIRCGFRVYDPPVRWSLENAVYWRRIL